MLQASSEKYGPRAIKIIDLELGGKINVKFTPRSIANVLSQVSCSSV